MRHDVHVEEAWLAPDHFPLDIAGHNGSPLFYGLRHQRPEFDGPIRQIEIVKGTAQIARRQGEKRATALVEQRDEMVAVDDDLRIGTRIECGRIQIVSPVLVVERFVGVRPVHDGQAFAPVVLGDFAEDPAPQVDGREQLRVGHQHFGLTEKKHAVFAECEMEPRQDPALRLGVEVHQRVAAQAGC